MNWLTRESAFIRLDFIEHQSERSGIAAGYRGCLQRRFARFELQTSSRRVWDADLWQLDEKQARGSRSLSCASELRKNATARPITVIRTTIQARSELPVANGTPGNGAAAPAGSVSAGTHLVREWNGRTYQVEVIDNGYRFDGKTYPSLTTIAKRITGTHWSGPRFFGLTPKRKA